MFKMHSLVTLSLLAALSTASTVAPRAAHAGISDTVLALAGPLAEQYGVPVSAVTGLLESGVSLDSVTQLLLVSQSSDTSLDSVSKLFGESDNDVDATAKKLDVSADDYSQEKVSASIDEAKATAQADATSKAASEASDALGSALGGLTR